MSDSLESPQTVAHQASLSMGFPRQEYQSGLSFPSPGNLPDPGIEPASPVSLALTGGFYTAEPSRWRFHPPLTQPRLPLPGSCGIKLSTVMACGKPQFLLSSWLLASAFLIGTVRMQGCHESLNHCVVHLKLT